MALFEEYRNHRIITLGRETGEPINCYYAKSGLPGMVLGDSYTYANGEAVVPEYGIKMRLIAPQGGNKLETFLTERLGFVEGTDFERHGNGYRGGLLYFDILTDGAIGKLFVLASELSKTSFAEHVQHQGKPSPWGRRP